MQCTLLIPHLFWPGASAAAVTRDLALPTLTKVLARASIERTPPLTPEAWMCQAFNIQRQLDWPLAPLTLVLDGYDPGADYWLRADPVHLKIARDRLLLVDNALFDLDAHDAQGLVATLNTHFAESGVMFHAHHPRRWYVRLARTPALVTRALSEVAGRDVQGYLPSGADALAWHSLFNEIQMVLHEHAINESREARSEPAVNSVWFWGGGRRPTAVASRFQHVWSDSVDAAALAAAAAIPAETLPVDAAAWLSSVPDSKSSSDSHLITIQELATAFAYQDSDAWRERLAALEKRWLAPLARALRGGRLTRITLVALGETHCCSFAVRRADLLKVWRRSAPLSAYA